MKRISVFENSCTPNAREYYLYYFFDGEYFIITRDSKDNYRQNLTTLVPNLACAIDFIANRIKQGNTLYIESGDDFSDYNEELDNDKILDIHNKNTVDDLYIYHHICDLDELIEKCKK